MENRHAQSCRIGLLATRADGLSLMKRGTRIVVLVDGLLRQQTSSAPVAARSGHALGREVLRRFTHECIQPKLQSCLVLQSYFTLY